MTNSDSTWQQDLGIVLPGKTSLALSLRLEHTDARGEIYSITLPDNRELMLLHSVKGSLRGGHSHSCDEIVVLLSGRMLYRKIINGKEVPLFLDPGDSSYNMAGQIHLAEFLEDSWVTEYKLAKKGEWTQEDYEPYRARVKANAAH